MVHFKYNKILSKYHSNHQSKTKHSLLKILMKNKKFKFARKTVSFCYYFALFFFSYCTSLPDKLIYNTDEVFDIFTKEDLVKVPDIYKDQSSKILNVPKVPGDDFQKIHIISIQSIFTSGQLSLPNKIDLDNFSSYDIPGKIQKMPTNIDEIIALQDKTVKQNTNFDIQIFPLYYMKNELDATP